VLLEQNDEYQLQCRYMQVEAMAALATQQIEEATPLQITPKPADPMRPGATPEITPLPQT
jgi:hypothetical protein